MRNKLKSMVVVLAMTFLGLLAPSSVSAADFSASLTTSVNMNSFAKPAKVTTFLSVKNLQNSVTPTEIVLPVYGTDIKSLTASYTSGGKITVTLDAETKTAKLQTTKSFKGKGKTWKIRLGYSSNLLEKFAEARLSLFQPTSATINGIAISSESRRVSLDLGLGVPTRLGGVPTTVLDLGRQVVTWREKGGQIDYQTGLFFGDAVLANVKVETTLRNNWPWWRKVKLVLPPDTNQQKAVLKSITPQPTKISVDKDSNITAEYRLRPFGSVKVATESDVLVGNYTYDLNKAKPELSETEQATFGDYLEPVKGWSGEKLTFTTGSKIADKINKIVADVKSKAGAEATITETVNSLAGSLRINGIPSRVVVGLLTEGGEATNHTWAEAYIADLGWVTVEANSPMVQTADPRYVALAVRSESASSPTPNFADTVVAYKTGDELPINDFAPTISSKTYLFFPWVGLRVTSVQLPVGVVTDDAAILILDDRITPLGSLAPAQKVASRDPLLGSKAHKKYTVQFGILDEEGAVSKIAVGKSTVSWLPFIVICVVLTLAVATSVVWMKKDKLAKFKTLKIFNRNQVSLEVTKETPLSATDKPSVPPEVVPASEKPTPKKPPTLIQ